MKEQIFPLQVNYFPSRFDPVRHAERYPYNNTFVSGLREKRIIDKENNFKQPGDRFRSWDPARQERFVGRISGMLSHPKCTQVRFFKAALCPDKMSSVEHYQTCISFQGQCWLQIIAGSARSFSGIT